MRASLADNSLTTALLLVDPVLFAAVAIASLTFGEVVSDALADFLRFFPRWHTGEHWCSNQGDYPPYMLVSGAYFETTLYKCCKRFYSWDFETCMDKGGAGRFAGSLEIDDPTMASYNFYADYSKMHCVQSCLENESSDTLNCGGLAPSWQVTFVDATECCSHALSWENQLICVASSTKTTVATNTTAASSVGTGDWYVHWKDFKCVKDCDKSLSQCGGLAQFWDEKFKTSAECCDKQLSWLPWTNKTCT